MELKDLKFDKRNYRRHSDRNKEIIKKSVEEVGFGRSIVIDNENEIVCGNGVVSQVNEDTPIKVIETDGTELIVVKRTDLATNDNKRKQLAVMDNSASDTSDFDLTLLQEGFAIDDFFNPDRIVIGTSNKVKIKPIIEKIYPKQYHNRLLFTDIESAELIKYASNAFLATKIHYINEIANLCEKTGANIKEVAIGMGLDTRIGTKFLCAGAGYGGSCFPKDTEALNYIAKYHNVDLDIVNAVIKGNKKRKLDLAYRIINKVKNIENPIIAIMGIAFKSGTDDCRESSAIDIIKYIQMTLNTAKIRCYDKLAIKNAKNCLENVEFYENIENTIKNTNIIVIMNEDEEFKSINVDNIPIFDYRGIMPNRQNVFKIGVNNFNA